MERAASGEEIVIAKAGRPTARLVSFEPRAAPSPMRRFGQLARQGFWIADNFNDPLPEDIERALEGTQP